MTNYEIISLDPRDNCLMVRYTEDGQEDCTIPVYLPTGIESTEEQLHEIARQNAVSAIIYWRDQEALASAQVDLLENLSTKTGVVKEVVANNAPEFDEHLYEIHPTVTETETQIIHDWELVPLTDGQRKEAVRIKRDTLLSQTDNECLSDRTPSQELLDYRQSLRDIPQQDGFPSAVVWPIKPSSGNEQ